MGPPCEEHRRPSKFWTKVEPPVASDARDRVGSNRFTSYNMSMRTAGCHTRQSDFKGVLRPTCGSSGGDFDDGAGSEPGSGTATISKPKSQTRTPSLYRVILMNDDFTPMDFVIHVLQKFFNKDMAEATRIMLQVHHQGAGLCGVYTYEIAETKVYQVNQYSRQNRHPLKCAMEKA